MAALWVLNRFEEDENHPKLRFAFQGTVNWMRALAILCSQGEFESEQLSKCYESTRRRVKNKAQDTIVFRRLVLALSDLHFLSEVKALASPYSVSRQAVIAWYYSIYNSANAMIAAFNGQDPQTHSNAQKIWQSLLKAGVHVCFPFHLAMDGITPNQIQTVRSTNPYELNQEPTSLEEAKGSVYSYLSGTASWKQEYLLESIKNEPDFKALGVSSFRTKQAREYRDIRLSKFHINFLLQAFRFRGKANYRDSLYLSYGPDNSDRITQFLEDLHTVSLSFLRMVEAYVSRRVISKDMQFFLADLRVNAKFDIPFP